MLTDTHDTPTPNRPGPKRKPRNAARPGELPSHNTNSSAGERIASGNRSKGENASGSNRPATPAATSARAGGNEKILLPGFLPAWLFNRGHFQQINTTTVGAQDFKAQVIDFDLLAATRYMAEAGHDQPADGLDFLLGE